jgi:hypothetical protein
VVFVLLFAVLSSIACDETKLTSFTDRGTVVIDVSPDPLPAQQTGATFELTFKPRYLIGERKTEEEGAFVVSYSQGLEPMSRGFEGPGFAKWAPSGGIPGWAR